MHKKRNMHDFPIYHCLTSFEHVYKDLRGGDGERGGVAGGCLSRGCGTMAWWWARPDCPFKEVNFIFFTLPQSDEKGRSLPFGPAYDPALALPTHKPPPAHTHTLTSLTTHSFL